MITKDNYITAHFKDNERKTIEVILKDDEQTKVSIVSGSRLAFFSHFGQLVLINDFEVSFLEEFNHNANQNIYILNSNKDWLITFEKNTEEQFNLAVNYEFGQLGSVQDISKAVSYYTKAAEQGLPDSQMNLAEYYSRDNVGNFKEAIKWYEKCKDTEFKGKFQLGLLVHRGTGIDQDKSRGLRLLREAADEGDHDTKIDLADYLSYLMSDQDTTMTNEDFSDEIDQLTNDVIENGSDEFLHLTGVDYAMSGDWHKARPLIEKASSRSYPDAMVALASMYMNGYGGLEQDFNEAKRLLSEAIDLGSEHAKTMLDAIDYRPYEE